MREGNSPNERLDLGKHAGNAFKEVYLQRQEKPGAKKLVQLKYFSKRMEDLTERNMGICGQLFLRGANWETGQTTHERSKKKNSDVREKRGDSTESEIISLDAILRLDGVPALDLRDLIVTVFTEIRIKVNKYRETCPHL